MEISQLGEFGLIDRLTTDLSSVQPTTLKSVGDDCAVLGYDGTTRQLVTTDLLMEGIHFDLVYTPLRQLGYKAVMVNLSDVYAMNGTPRQVTISLAVDNRLQVEDLDEFYAGMRLACEQHQVDIVGGDTTSSLTGLCISITCIGDAPEPAIVKRSGAKPTDLICCSGNLGAAYLGLQLLEREKAIYLQQVKEGRVSDNAPFQPDFSGREYLLQRILQPEARRDIVQTLRAAGIVPTAMMDISDGLSSELLHICKQSGVGCRLYEERIPLDYQTAAAAEELNLNVSTCALNGGEDYELLFTVPLSMHDQVEQLEDVSIIGHITDADEGAVMVGRGGTEMSLRAQGWNPLN
ncbi:MAG: thiamine-phosphate kinase [Bacteroidaceae bacterium]|nr:thiamine-phosphate kinase [Bacteroidaceae bacterium]